jgi:hypothetical protein
VEVRSIGRREFHRLYPYTGELSPFIGEGAEWFTNEAGSVVGIIARRATQPAWKYAVLKRSSFGDFQVWHVGEVNGDIQTTRNECGRAMTAVDSGSETVGGIHLTSRKEPLQYFFQQPHRNSPWVVIMILAGDIITVSLVLFWLFRRR